MIWVRTRKMRPPAHAVYGSENVLPLYAQTRPPILGPWASYSVCFAVPINTLSRSSCLFYNSLSSRRAVPQRSCIHVFLHEWLGLSVLFAYLPRCTRYEELYTAGSCARVLGPREKLPLLFCRTFQVSGDTSSSASTDGIDLMIYCSFKY